MPDVGFTVVTGVIGDDIHVVGIRILEYALRNAGFHVVPLGPLSSQREFIDAAIETSADAIFVSSLNGHAETSLAGFRNACIEAGIGDILIFGGGQLTIRKPNWSEVEELFVGELGLSRIYPAGTSPDVAIADLLADLGAKSASNDSDGDASKPDENVGIRTEVEP